MLPPIGRWSDDKAMVESASRLARLAMMAGDGTTHHNPYYPSWIGYPTRPTTEALVRLVLTPDPAAGENYNRGFSLKEYFAAAWNFVDADPGDDDEAKALLMAYYERILVDPIRLDRFLYGEATTPGQAIGGVAWYYSAENVDRAVALLASAEPDSLWTVAVQRAFPDHPQTPGSAKWLAEEEKAQQQGRQAHHESDPNPFTD